MSAMPLPLPSATDQVSSVKWLLASSYYLDGEETLEGDLQAEVDAKPKHSTSEQMRGEKSPAAIGAVYYIQQLA